MGSVSPLRLRIAVVCLGFASGLPLMLTADTLAAWLTDHGLKLAAIGAFAAVGAPYTFKFLWAPLLDRYAPPLVGRFMDRRRGWIVLAQALLALSIVLLAQCDPTASVVGLAVAAGCVAFASATQDIVIDAWRTEALDRREAARGASLHVLGYRVAMLASGAGALVLRGAGLTWAQTYAVCGALLVVGVVGVALAPAPRSVAPPATLRDAVVLPFRDLLSRRTASARDTSAPTSGTATAAGLLALLFIVVFKLPDVVAGSMTMPFLRQIGFDVGVVGWLRQGIGLFVTIGGTLAGGWIAARVGLHRALVVYGVLQAVSNLAFWALAVVGPDVGALAAAVVVENFCAGLVTAGFLGFLQRQCTPALAATQFALLTSLMAVPSRFLGAPAGWLAEALGWPAFFASTVLLGLPGMLLLARLDARTARGPLDEPAPVPAGAT